MTSRASFRRGILPALVLLGLSIASPSPVHADTLAVQIPRNVGAQEHWVDVNRSQQVAVAMIGGTAVRAIFVTTGQPGWETPTGTFHISRRIEDETMTSAALGIRLDSPDGYDLEHVLYTQYFDNDGDAIHLNYWRPDSVFGSQATSHGCVGARLEDAKFFWDFLSFGSRVVIHD